MYLYLSEAVAAPICANVSKDNKEQRYTRKHTGRSVLSQCSYIGAQALQREPHTTQLQLGYRIADTGF